VLTGAASDRWGRRSTVIEVFQTRWSRPVLRERHRVSL